MKVAKNKRKKAKNEGKTKGLYRYASVLPLKSSGFWRFGLWGHLRSQKMNPLKLNPLKTRVCKSLIDSPHPTYCVNDLWLCVSGAICDLWWLIGSTLTFSSRGPWSKSRWGRKNCLIFSLCSKKSWLPFGQIRDHKCPGQIARSNWNKIYCVKSSHHIIYYSGSQKVGSLKLSSDVAGLESFF